LFWHDVMKRTIEATATIGAFEAKTKFSELLERVSKGAEITITRHEKPIAKLVPFDQPSRVELNSLFRQMDEFRAKHPLNRKGLEKITYRELIDGGRKR
jgi:prevent-host-death family protein